MKINRTKCVYLMIYSRANQRKRSPYFVAFVKIDGSFDRNDAEKKSNLAFNLMYLNFLLPRRSAQIFHLLEKKKKKNS